MAITTYAELKTAIEDWLDRTDLTSYTGDFIALAEKRMITKLKVREMVQRSTATMPTGDRYLAIPSDFLAVKQFQLNTTPLRTLEFVPEDTINLYNTSTSGKPYYYTITGSEFQFDKIPDSTYTAEITYFQFSPLSDTNTTNELFPKYSELYLQACLSQAYLFIKDNQKAQSHEMLYGMYANDIVLNDEKSRISQGTLIRKADVIE